MKKAQFNSLCLTLDKSYLSNLEKENQLTLLVAIQTMWSWQNRAKYLDLCEDYLENKINADTFLSCIIELTTEMNHNIDEISLNLSEKVRNKQNLDHEYYEISKFFQNSKYDELLSLLSGLLFISDAFTTDLETYESDPGYYLNDEKFRIQAENLISKLKPCFQNLN